MRRSVSCLTLGVGLVVGTLNAQGQTHGPTIVAQAPVTVPPSGILPSPPPAPVALPPSGVLPSYQPAPVAVPPSGVLVTPPTAERHAVATVLVKTGQRERTAARAAPGTMRRHVVHLRSARHRRTVTRTAPVDQSTAAAPSGASTAAEQPSIDELGYGAFLTQIGKAKQAK